MSRSSITRPDKRGPERAPKVREAAPSRGGKPNAIRIIGGEWKRTPLPVLSLHGLRPTPDRVRETVFNWLGQSLSLPRVTYCWSRGLIGLRALPEIS